jgi:tripartite-type tricarboxylate transporter receptor subunit TctC
MGRPGADDLCRLSGRLAAQPVGHSIAIAVGSPQRVGVIPDVRTIAEQGFKGFDTVSWSGLMDRTGTPDDMVDRICTEVQALLAEKDTQDKLLNAADAIAN